MPTPSNTPLKPPARNNFFLALGSYLISTNVCCFRISWLDHLGPATHVVLSVTHASFSTKTTGSASGSKHSTMHLLRHNATHIVVRSMGSAAGSGAMSCGASSKLCRMASRDRGVRGTISFLKVLHVCCWRFSSAAFKGTGPEIWEKHRKKVATPSCQWFWCTPPVKL